MLENGDQENLGITGYPAEMSIYRSPHTGDRNTPRGLRGVGIPPTKTGRYKQNSPHVERH